MEKPMEKSMEKEVLLIMPSFEKRMCSHLATHFTRALVAHNIDLEHLEAFVKSGLEKAKRYGLTNKTDMQFFLEFLATYGPDSEASNADSWLQKILRREDLNRLRKIREIKLKSSVRQYN